MKEDASDQVQQALTDLNGAIRSVESVAQHLDSDMTPRYGGCQRLRLTLLQRPMPSSDVNKKVLLTHGARNSAASR